MVKEKIHLLINDKNKINFFIYGVGQVFNLISPLLIAPKVISTCGVDAFGKVGLAFSLCLFLIIIVDYAFDIKGIKKISENRKNKEKLQKIFSTTIFTKSILFIFTLIISFGLIFFIDPFYQEKNLFLFSLTIVFAQVFNPVWFLQGIENFKLISILNISSKLLYVFLVYYFINNENEYFLVNFFLGFSSFLFNIIGIYLIKKHNITKIIAPQKKTIIKILKNDFTFCVSQMLLSIRQLSPLVLISSFLGFSMAGQYKVIEQLISFCRTFIQVFLKFFYPSACLKYFNNNKEGIQYWKKYTISNIIIITLFIFIIFCFSDNILNYFKLSTSDINSISSLFKTSLLVSILMSISLPFEQLMFIKEKQSKYIFTIITVTITNLLIIVLFINIYQLSAIIFSLILSELLFIFFYYIFTKESFKIVNNKNENK